MYKLHLNKTDHHRGQLNFCNQQKFANEYIISVIQYQAIFSEVQTHDFCSDANGFQCRNPKDLKFSTEQKTNFREFEVLFFFRKMFFPIFTDRSHHLFSCLYKKQLSGLFDSQTGSQSTVTHHHCRKVSKKHLFFSLVVIMFFSTV